MAARKLPNDIQALMAAGLLRRGSDDRFCLQVIPFGIPDLDAIMGGAGGVPRARITVLLGEDSSGKSFLVQLLIKRALEHGLACAYIDLEHTYEPNWWRQVGINVDQLYVAQPETGEQAVDLATALVVAKLDVVVIDSLAALIPAVDTAESAEQQYVGLQARLIGRLLRKLVAVNEVTAVVCTNQVREAIGTLGPLDVMPGGWQLRHYTSLRLRVRREGWIYDGDTKTGFYMRVACRKNKVGRAFGECLLPFHFRGEIDLLGLLAERAIEAGLIEQRGPWYRLLGAGEAVLGKNALIDNLRANTELRIQLEVALGDKVGAPRHDE